MPAGPPSPSPRLWSKLACGRTQAGATSPACPAASKAGDVGRFADPSQMRKLRPRGRVRGGGNGRGGTKALWVYLFIYLFGWVGSSLRYAGFSLRWLLLLRSTGSRRVGFNSCGALAQ